MLFRLLTVGLCAACVVLLVTFEPVRFTVTRPAAVPPPVAVAGLEPRLSVVDVASDVAPASIYALVGLKRHEWIKSINDQSPPDDLAADELMRSLVRRGGFLDLTVARSIGSNPAERRVLMLIH